MKPTLDLLLGLLGLRRPRTAVTAAEAEALLRYARGAREVVEVGVAEGATSAKLLAVMDPCGLLWAVDPYPERLRLERWLGTSGTLRLARRSVRSFQDRVKFVLLSSEQAALALRGQIAAELIFLDARHDDLSVSQDLRLWAPLLAPGGAIAVHDAVPCPSRPELQADQGGCRAVREFLSSGWRLAETAESLAILERK